jgi:hypothetical protein
MDVVEKILPYPAVPEIAQVYAALAPYLMFGIVPLAIPPFFRHQDTGGTVRQPGDANRPRVH